MFRKTTYKVSEVFTLINHVCNFINLVKYIRVQNWEFEFEF